jgi:FixJ family two-component response regulator
MNTTNPWRLSDGEQTALDAVIEHKTIKGAAMALRLSPKTVSVQTIRARKKMEAWNLLDVLLTWDRYRRAEA